MFQYSAKMIRVVDGDTVWLEIDLGFYASYRTSVRLADIDAPERIEYTPKGLKDPAKEYIESCIPAGDEVVIDVTKKDKYGRWLGVIRFLPGNVGREDILQNGRNLNQELLDRKLVKPYKNRKS